MKISLGDAGYEIVATVDDLDEALDVLDREEVHLILSDVRLREQRTGIELARAAKERASRPCSRPATPIPARARSRSVACCKPYTERQLCKAIECVDRHLQGDKIKSPKGLELFMVVDEED